MTYAKMYVTMCDDCKDYEVAVLEERKTIFSLRDGKHRCLNCFKEMNI